VIGGATFAAGLPATVITFPLAQRVMRSHGFAPPAYSDLSLLDSPGLRAVVGSAALLSLVVVLALALGAVLRNSAGAITAVVVLGILPQMPSPSCSRSRTGCCARPRQRPSRSSRA
jgi:hypothetical protein